MIETIAFASLALSIIALIRSHRTERIPPMPTVEEMISDARGHIDACRAVEYTLLGRDEPLDLIILSQHRSNAARAKQELRLLGIEL